MPVDTQRWPVHTGAGLEAKCSRAQTQYLNPGLQLVYANGWHMCVCNGGLYTYAQVQGTRFQVLGWIGDVRVDVGVLVVGVGCLGTSTGTLANGINS